jgi:ubiquinone/menaquinone biosynthesis C-methylase UbiE
MNLLKRWYLNSPVYNFNLVERDRWVARQAGRIPPGSRVLDVGAGSCPYRSHFHHCVYRTQDSAALSPEQLRDKHGYGQINYVCSATDIPVDDGSFDVVLCTEVLEHVPEPARVVAELGRVLRPGGVLLLTAPLGSGLHQLPLHFYGGYTPFWYRKVLQEAGFERVEIEANGGFFKHYGQETIRLAKLTAPTRLAAPLLFRLFWTPFWLAALPWMLLLCPAMAYYFDRWDHQRDFTIGYHVSASRSEARVQPRCSGLPAGDKVEAGHA